MHKNKLVIILIMSLCLLIGCGQKLDAEVSTIIIEKDGQITGIEIEDFSEPNYEELQVKEMIEQEVSAYNKNAGEEKIKVTSFDVGNKIAKLVLQYASAQDYKNFNGEALFVGTIEEAIAQGYDINVRLVDHPDAEKANEITQAQLQEMKEETVIICETPVRIRAYQKIKYYNPEGSLVNSKEFDAFNVKELSYIIL